MPRFEPFPAIRYATDPLDAVTAPPYDVLSAADRAELAARHPHNVVVVDLPRDAEGAPSYRSAATVMQRWLQEGVLVRDPQPTFTIDRMSFHDEAGQERHSVGVIGGLEVVDAGTGDVLPHEQTTPRDRSDRLELTRATRANLSPIWGLSMAEGLSDLLAESGETVGDFVDETGVRHRVERVRDPARLAALTRLVASAPVVIADGHHRYEVARVHRDEVRASEGGRPGPHDLTMAFLVELVDDQLHVEAIHRLLDGLPGDTTWRGVLAASFELQAAGAVDASTLRAMVARGALCLVDADGQGTFLVPRPGAFDGVEPLDSARLAHALRDVPHTVRFQHGLDHVVDEVGRGEAQAAVLLRPVTVADIARTAHARALMPPKSTFFTPKLRTGLTLRSLEG